MEKTLEQRFVAARRKRIEQSFSHLNPMQRQAVLATEGPLLLLAGAGSGKTTVLIDRVANLLRFGCASDSEELPSDVTEEDVLLLEAAVRGEKADEERVQELCELRRVRPWQILAITFTNKAAGELKSRLEARLGDSSEGVWAMTFHSTCARILRRDADRLGFTKNFTIYDQADSLSVMKRVIREMNIDEKTWPPRAMLSAASRYKGAGLSAEEALAAEQKTGDLRKIRTAQVFVEYARRLREADAMDFDDLLYFCVKLLEEYEEVRSYYQDKFRYVLIDEYQDTNHLQYRMAAILAAGRNNICVVGDDDQSIYRFRGATIENILNFEDQYKNARVIRLEQNYRSTGNILAAANAVISNNTERKGKQLWTEAGNGSRIVHYIAANENDEADFVVRTIRESGRSPRDFAILYRTNAQSRILEQAFRKRKIEYRIFGGTRFFDRAEVKDMLAYLCVVANPTDETRLLRIINNPPRGIGAASVEKAQEIARTEEKPLFDVLRNAAMYPELSRSAGKLMAFTGMISELQNSLSQGTELDEFYDELLDKSGYVRMLEQKNGVEEQTRIENVQELKSSIVKSVQENNGGDLYAYLDEVALYSELDNYDESAEYTVMMTMHAAKGLEFPVVFLVGAEEGLFPGLSAVGNDEEMEEERRLCYVAITRAREQLYISSAAQRMLYGRTAANLPSRFVEEIPEELVDKRENALLNRPARYEHVGYSEYASYAQRRVREDPVYGQGSSYRSGSVATRHAPAKPKTKTTISAPAQPSFKTGDKVMHKSFGKGVIVKMTPMGGDALTEIEFEKEGVKRLMLRVAAQHMTKLD